MKLRLVKRSLSPEMDDLRWWADIVMDHIYDDGPNEEVWMSKLEELLDGLQGALNKVELRLSSRYDGSTTEEES